MAAGTKKNLLTIIKKSNDMHTQSSPNSTSSLNLVAMEPLRANAMVNVTENAADELKNFFQRFHLPGLDELLRKLTSQTGKRNFLVFKNNKYINVQTENIAFFFIKFESPMIMCFDRQEYFVNYSLEQIK